MQEHSDCRLYVGSYTSADKPEGIYLLALDPGCGLCSAVQANAETENPSYLLLDGRRLFAANERSDCACLSAFAVEEDGSVKLAGTYCAEGAGTCQVTLDPMGAFLYGANYESGSIAGCRVLPDGSLGAGISPIAHEGSSADPERQENPHVHMVGFAPESSSLIAVDLGIDELVTYAVEEDGELRENPERVLPVFAGEGPRMVAYHPALPLAALITELGNHVIVYRFGETGLASWEPLAAYPLAASGYAGEALAAHVQFSPDGRYLYASVRGPNEICVFSVAESGALELRGAFPSSGSWPRHMELSPDGTMLAVANERSDEVVVFGIDRDSGALSSEVARCGVSSPTCVVWQR